MSHSQQGPTEYYRGGYGWDPVKNQGNVEKHGVSFERASYIFSRNRDPMIEKDTRNKEPRFKAVGEIDGKPYLVVYAERRNANGQNYKRLVSAREARDKDLKKYNEYRKNSGRTAERKDAGELKEIRSWTKLDNRQTFRRKPEHIRREARMEAEVKKEVADYKKANGVGAVSQEKRNEIRENMNREKHNPERRKAWTKHALKDRPEREKLGRDLAQGISR